VWAPDRGGGVKIDIPAAYLWGVATPFMVVAALWLIGVVLLALYGWWVNR
jgi:hypothetical protein